MSMKWKVEEINRKMDTLFDMLLKENVSLSSYKTMNLEDLEGIHLTLRLYDECKDLMVDIAEEYDENRKFREDVNRKLDKLLEKAEK